MSEAKKEEKIPDDSDIMRMCLGLNSDEKKKIQIEITEKNLNNLRCLALFNDCSISKLIDFLLEWQIERIIGDCYNRNNFEVLHIPHLMEE
ncbi:MAG: hypothetical protein ACOC7O_00645 [Thermoplasmatota archaeon]